MTHIQAACDCIHISIGLGRAGGSLRGLRLKLQKNGQYVACLLLPSNIAPASALGQYRDLGSVGDKRQNITADIRGHAQIEYTAIRGADDGSLGTVVQSDRRIRLAGGIQQSDLRQLTAFIIKIENLTIPEALIRHIHSAALAHADTVSKPAGSQCEGVFSLGDRPQLIVRSVDGQAESLLQLTENVKCDSQGAERTVQPDGQVAIQLCIESAGLCVAWVI